MGEVYTGGKRGGKPKQIDGFSGSMQIITETTTWTCPATGEYYISCIGQGGDHGCIQDYQNTTVVATGGGGGIAESKLKLQKGNEIKITINDGVSSFGGYLSATGGQNANLTLSTNFKKYVTKGGSGSGGNVGNFSGNNGTTQDGGMGVIVQGGGTNENAKYGGAAGGEIIGLGVINKNICYSTCPTTANCGMYPYGSSQMSGMDGNYSELVKIKNGAVIIEYMG